MKKIIILVVVLAMMGGAGWGISSCIKQEKRDAERQEKEWREWTSEIKNRNQEFANSFLQPHPLRKLMPKEIDVSENKWRGSFFLFTGSISGEGKTYSDIMVWFAWPAGDGVYSISSLPLKKIRIKLVNNNGPAAISFKTDLDLWAGIGRYYVNGVPYWAGDQTLYDQFEKDSAEFLKENVVYATITCREQDWSTEIKMPLNGD